MNPVKDFSGFFPYLNLFGLAIPTYYLVISLTFCLCIFWFIKRAEDRDFDRMTALDFSLVIMVASFLGARIFHIVFEHPEYYSDHPERVFYVWEGGFVFFGGAFAAAVASLWLMRRRKMPIGRWLDTFAPVGALGYALGRVACLLTGCCYGSVCVLPHFSFRHPTQAYAILTETLTLLVLLRLEKSKTPRPSGSIFVAWIFLHGCGRLLMETFREDDRGPLLPYDLSISSALSWILILTALSFAFIWRRKIFLRTKP